MQTRGRHSAAKLAVITNMVNPRQAPPAFLSADERRLWVEIVETKPAEWFGPDSAPILVEFVRAVDTCNLLANQVREALESGEPDWIERFLKLRDKESRRAADLATKLRLTQQSRYTPQAAATANKRTMNATKPWETEQSGT
jgi:hypothetical protein